MKIYWKQGFSSLAWSIFFLWPFAWLITAWIVHGPINPPPITNSFALFAIAMAMLWAVIIFLGILSFIFVMPFFEDQSSWE